MKSYPFVIVENCEEACSYYQQIFGGDIKTLHEHQGKLLHAELHFPGGIIHFSDPFHKEYMKGENMKIMMQFDSEEEMKAVYEQLSTDGKITVELQHTFFGALHGQVTDKNNINWVFNYFKNK